MKIQRRNKLWLSKKKQRIIEPFNGEFHFPEPIIQHIQSFLNGKEAAQTTLFSKSWYTAWSTRPNLDFDQLDFPTRKISQDRFLENAKKTMKRYEDLQLTIDSFRLLLMHENLIAEELIVRAIKMGVKDFCFEILYRSSNFTLPLVVFESTTLIRLYVSGCKIVVSGVQFNCSRLVSLSLDCVDIKREVLWDIISSCPSIVDFKLSCWYSSFVSVVEGPTNVYVLRKLKALSLGNVAVDELFFVDMSSKFPCLKDLSIENCGGYNHQGISLDSLSLESISFTQKGNTLLRGDFDVPRIRKFKFSGGRCPDLFFSTNSGEWESDISIRCNKPNAKWFAKLHSLLTSLSSSTIYLSLKINSVAHVVDVEELVDIQGLAVVVKNLTMRARSSSSHELWECLFRICRPKFITQEIWKCNCGLLESLCKRLNAGECLMSDYIMQVNVELFEESVAEWRPQPWKTLIDVSSRPRRLRKVRLRLDGGLVDTGTN